MRTTWLTAIALAFLPIWHLHLGKFVGVFWVVSIVMFAVALLSLIAARDAHTGCGGFTAEP